MRERKEKRLIRRKRGVSTCKRGDGMLKEGWRAGPVGARGEEGRWWRKWSLFFSSILPLYPVLPSPPSLVVRYEEAKPVLRT
jgi:hypothetical protein